MTHPRPFLHYSKPCVLALLWVLHAVAQADEPRHFDPKIELPQTEGKALVLRACTQCHELAGLAAYKGYWNRAKWKELVVGMVKHGAALQPAEQEKVTDYLTQHFGPGTRTEP